MIKKIFNSKKSVLFTILFLFGLVSIRIFERKLFYDPFLHFFRTEYENQQLPVFDGFKLFLNIVFRYSLNTLLSLGIILAVFKEKVLLVFSSWLYLVFFIVLTMIFFGLLFFSEKPDYWLLFYVRRFLIQPLFLLLFLPAFFYQKLKNKEC